MNEWKPNYRTRPGVEVMIRQCDSLWRVTTPVTPEHLNGPLCCKAEIDALFEPIPKPATVEVGLSALRNLLKCFDDLDRPDKPCGFSELRRAAERAAETKSN